MPTLYAKLKKLAKPVVQHYHADLTEHDRATMRAARPGDVFAWYPREHGTCLVHISSRREPLTRDQANIARGYLDACIDAHKPPALYLVECTTPQNGHVFETPAHAIHAIIERSARHA